MEPINIVKNYISAGLFKDTKALWDRYDGIVDADFIHDALKISNNRSIFYIPEYLDEAWYNPVEPAIFTELLNKLHININPIDCGLINIQQNIALHNHKSTEFDYIWGFSYNNQKYYFFIYAISGCYEPAFYSAALANNFLSIINHPKRYYMLNANMDEYLTISSMNYKIHDTIPTSDQLSFELIDWNKFGYTPYDLKAVSDILGDKYITIINQKYFTTLSGVQIDIIDTYSVVSSDAHQWLLQQTPYIHEKFDNIFSSIENNNKISLEAKELQLWKEAVYIRNLFVAIARQSIYDRFVIDYLYKHLPLWDENQKFIFDKLKSQSNSFKHLSELIKKTILSEDSLGDALDYNKACGLKDIGFSSDFS